MSVLLATRALQPYGPCALSRHFINQGACSIQLCSRKVWPPSLSLPRDVHEVWNALNGAERMQCALAYFCDQGTN